MANILFLTLDAGGNVPPALAIAGELTRRGHRVRFLAAPSQVPRLAARGIDAMPYRHARNWTPAVRATALRGPLSFAALLSDRGYAADAGDALAREPADLIVLDALMPASVVPAKALGIPVLVLMHSFAGFFLRSPAITALAAVQGVPTRRAWSAADAILVASDRDLDPAAGFRVPKNLAWIGVAEDAPARLPVWDPSTEPRVLVSLSTVAISGQEGVLRKVLDAV